MRPCKRSKNDAIHVVNNVREASITCERGESSCYSVIPAYAILSSSKIHRELSKVWDEYKIEKIGVRLHFIDNNTVSDQKNRYYQLYTVWDDNETSANIKYTELATYETFKQTPFSALARNMTPCHTTSFQPKGGYTSTKKTPNNGSFVFGLYSRNVFDKREEFMTSIQFTFTVCYRGSRFDSSWVSTKIPLDFSEISAPIAKTIIQEVPVPTKINIDSFQLYSMGQTLPIGDIALPPFMKATENTVISGKTALCIYRVIANIDDDDDDHFRIRTVLAGNVLPANCYYFAFTINTPLNNSTRLFSEGRMVFTAFNDIYTSGFKIDTDLVTFNGLPDL